MTVAVLSRSAMGNQSLVVLLLCVRRLELRNLLTP